MLLWALDFDTRSITQLQHDSAGATEHFRWFDLTPGEFDAWLEIASGLELPPRLGTHVLEELEFSDAWLAFGLAEPRLDRDRSDPAGMNLLFAESVSCTGRLSIGARPFKRTKTLLDHYRYGKRSRTRPEPLFDKATSPPC